MASRWPLALVAAALVASVLSAACGDASDPTSLIGRRNVGGPGDPNDPASASDPTNPSGGDVGTNSSTSGVNGAVPAGAGIPCDVAALLAEKCQSCHGSTPVPGALSPLVTVADLLAPAKEDATKNEAELSLARMKNAASPMPPASFANPVNATEIAAVEKWIAAGYQGSCADGGAPPPPANLTCTSCHGDANRAAITGADANLKSAPPRGSKGETAVSARAVGAHQTHVATSDLMANPIQCNDCHVVPTSTSHSNGVAEVTFGTLAKTGGKAPAWNGTTCAASYCHGNFTGGNTGAAPSWTSGTAMTCTSCHGAPPATGDHQRGAHQFACSNCHGNGYTATTVNKATHINGQKNVGGAGSNINNWNPATRSCSPTCHGTETW